MSTPIVEDEELDQPYKSVKRAEAGSVSSSDYKPEYVSDDNTPAQEQAAVKKWMESLGFTWVVGSNSSGWWNASNITMPPHAAALFYRSEQAACQKAVEEDLKARIAGLKRKPTHGNCCTCQSCGQYHDDCNCEVIAVLEAQLATNTKGDT